MVDPLAAIIAYLFSDASLNAITEGRIAAKHKFGEGWDIPSKALQVRFDGGTPDLYTERQIVRIEARCYGESQAEASRLFRNLVAISRTVDRERVETGEGVALIYYMLMGSGPSLFKDPEIGVDVVVTFLNVAVSEVDIP